MDDFSGGVCGNNVKYPLIGAMREELRGVSRGKDAKDVDWEKVAASFDDLPVRKCTKFFTLDKFSCLNCIIGKTRAN